MTWKVSYIKKDGAIGSIVVVGDLGCVLYANYPDHIGDWNEQLVAILKIEKIED
jgi:hypothetical protein